MRLHTILELFEEGLDYMLSGEDYIECFFETFDIPKTWLVNIETSLKRIFEFICDGIRVKTLIRLFDIPEKWLVPCSIPA